MKVMMKPSTIVKDPENQVTSKMIMKKNQRKVTDKPLYDEKGIFSKKIFGEFDRCTCGLLQEPGFCEVCRTRVIERDNIPDFFIDLGLLVPKIYADYSIFKSRGKLIKSIMEYQTFITPNGKRYVVHDRDEADKMRNEDMLIGIDAVRFISDKADEWAERWATDFISVPHTAYRPNVFNDDGTIQITPINKTLVDVLSDIECIEEYKCYFSDEDKAILLTFYRSIYEKYENCMTNIYEYFTGSNKKNSFVSSNMRGHKVSSAVKGTVINRFDIDEDVVLIGDTFIQTLYPYLYKKYDGDMQKINDYLVDSDARILINRPPTICHLSIMGMKPRVASCYKLGTFYDGALGKNRQSRYDEGIDTIGIRTIAINPIICDGLASDFDGDSFLTISLFSEGARQEADEMLPSKNYMNYANGTIRNSVIEDVEYILDHELDDSTRQAYMEEYESIAKNLMFEEKLPLVGDIAEFVSDGKKSERLEHMFSFFDNEEGFSELVSRTDCSFTQEESDQFIESVIAANVTEISEAGYIYKKLQASGDRYRVVNGDCKSEGRRIELPIDESEFNYNVKNSFVYVDGKMMCFYNYKEFTDVVENLKVDEIFVRNPMTCKHHLENGVCEVCVGQIPNEVTNIGMFSTLMITEVATQAALSAMNKGVKDNVNKLLVEKYNGDQSLESFYAWIEELLGYLSGDSVERRFYEIALLSRLRYVDGKVEVKTLGNPGTDDFLGWFIYRPSNKSTYKRLIGHEEFEDKSMKAQIAMNLYDRL